MPPTPVEHSRWRVPGGIAVTVLSCAALLACGSRSTAAPAAASATQRGTLQLTDAQLRTLDSALISSAAFSSQTLTEGKIAFDADTLTAVYSPYSGRVVRVLAALGAAVARGAPLFALDASEFAQAQSDWLTASAALTLARQTEARRAAQYQAHSIALQDWQQSQNDLAASQAGALAVRNRLRILGQSDTQIDALVDQPAANASAVVKAPIGGVVTDRQIGVGQYLQAGASTPVYTIADLSSVWLVAYVREADAGSVHVGEPIRVQVLSLPGREFQAKLSYVAPTLDSGTRRLAVHAVLDNRDGALKPEMFASFRIVTGEASMAPAVPAQAVIYEGEQARVWVLQSAHEAALRQVQLGRTFDDRIEVLQGLAVGDRVVTRGALFIDRAGTGG